MKSLEWNLKLRDLIIKILPYMALLPHENVLLISFLKSFLDESI